MESPSSCRVTLSRSRAFDSSAPSIYPRSTTTSCSASDRVFRSASRASKDFGSTTSISAKWAFTASSSRSAAVAHLIARSSAAYAPIASAARSQDSRRADSSWCLSSSTCCDATSSCSIRPFSSQKNRDLQMDIISRSYKTRRRHAKTTV